MPTSAPQRIKPCALCRYPMNMGQDVTYQHRYHNGRGLCQFCYARCTRDGTLADYERVFRSADEVMGEWERLRLDGYSKNLAAERLGMTYKAFDRTFHRAKAAGDSRALPALFRHPFGTRFPARTAAA